MPLTPTPSEVLIPSIITSLPAQKGELVALLRKWSEINSGSDHLAGLDRMLGVLRAAFHAALPAAFIEEIALPGTTARALRLRLRPESPLRILCNGHYDTVYEASHSFQKTTLLDADTLRGPGVTDMKGGLVVMLAALRAFEQTPSASALGIEILITPDEEIGSRASLDAINVSARRNHFGLVFEPARAGGEIVRSRKGTGVLTVTCHGRAAHGAQPDAGRNAIAALSEFLVAAHRVPDEIPGTMLNIGVIRGGGVINIVPELAVAELHARITRIEQKDLLVARLAAIAEPINSREGYRLVIESAFDRPPKECGPVEVSAFADLRHAAGDLGLPPLCWVDTGGGSDGNLLSAAGLPNLDGLGPAGDHLHSEREYVHLPSLVTRAQLNALFLHRLAIGEYQLPR
jgi:glutamate carboxypeptidase